MQIKAPAGMSRPKSSPHSNNGSAGNIPLIEDDIDGKSDHTVCQNSISSSNIDQNEILAAKKRLEFVFDEVDDQ